MILVDAGPLIAIIDKSDVDHQLCVQSLRHLTSPLLTTWAVLVEAMYLLGDRVGWHEQEKLWKLVLRGDLKLIHLEEPELRRCYRLMAKYADLPMDLADSTLVAVAEKLQINRVFTLDDDFSVYRLEGKRPFDIVP